MELIEKTPVHRNPEEEIVVAKIKIDVIYSNGHTCTTESTVPQMVAQNILQHFIEWRKHYVADFDYLEDYKNAVEKFKEEIKNKQDEKK